MLNNLDVWHVLIILVVFGLIILPALVSIARARIVSGVETAVWVLVVVIAPLLGSLAWFAIGRPRARQNQPSTR